jgi:hypothetical protein
VGLDTSNGRAGTAADVPKTGTTIRVVKVNKKTKVMTIKVGTSG